MEPLRGGILDGLLLLPLLRMYGIWLSKEGLPWNGRCAGFGITLKSPWYSPEWMRSPILLKTSLLLRMLIPILLRRASCQLIEKVAQTYRKIMKVGCTGCGYCLPCPADVLIPSCFDIYSNMHMFNTTAEAPFMYVMRMGGSIDRKAWLCIPMRSVWGMSGKVSAANRYSHGAGESSHGAWGSSSSTGGTDGQADVIQIHRFLTKSSFATHSCCDRRHKKTILVKTLGRFSTNVRPRVNRDDAPVGVTNNHFLPVSHIFQIHFLC